MADNGSQTLTALCLNLIINDYCADGDSEFGLLKVLQSVYFSFRFLMYIFIIHCYFIAILLFSKSQPEMGLFFYLSISLMSPLLKLTC